MKYKLSEQLEDINMLTEELKNLLYLYYLTRKKMYLTIIREIQTKIDEVEELITKRKHNDS